MTLNKKLILLISFVSIFISVISITIVTLSSFKKMEEDALSQYQNSLQSKRILVTKSVHDYFDIIDKQLTVKAFDISTIEAAHAFKKGFANYPSADIETSSLTRYYEQDFKRVFDEKNTKKIDTKELYQTLSNTTLALQTKLIADNAHPLGNKDNLISLNNNTDYDKAHQRYHPSIRKFLKEFGYYDIFIVEPEQGHIVYSVYKELDYATSLTNGPYKDTGIAESFREALKLQAGETYLTDFKAYLPSYNGAASFISTPIFDKGQLIAVLIFQMPIDNINNIMTQSGKWLESGFGESAEIYLVGQDNTLRNESRFFVEDKENYLNLINAINTEKSELIKNKNTSISIQEVNTTGTKAALNGITGFGIFNDYRGVAVLSSYAPINIKGLSWAIMSEIDESEALKGVFHLEDEILSITFIILAFVAIGSTAIAYLLANKIIKPLKKLSERFTDLSHGEADLTVRVEKSGIPEIDEISNGFNLFIEQLHTVISSVKDAIHRVASSGTELGVTTEQSNESIIKQNERVSTVNDSLDSFSLSIKQITEQTVAAYEATATAQESAKENAEKASLASKNIELLVKEVDGSADVIKELQSHVEDISNVLTIINSIADQTNLLALNAAIEAARAGEHGRGFAVVADEVRSLAARTQESTVTVQSELTLLNDATNKSVESMDRASTMAKDGITMVESVSQTLNELSGIMQNISDLNGDISNESLKQSKDIEEITNNVHEIKEESEQISQASNNLTGVAYELSDVSENVDSNMNRFVV